MWAEIKRCYVKQTKCYDYCFIRCVFVLRNVIVGCIFTGVNTISGEKLLPLIYITLVDEITNYTFENEYLLLPSDREH